MEHMLLVEVSSSSREHVVPMVSNANRHQRRRRRPSMANASVLLQACAAMTCGTAYLSPVRAFQADGSCCGRTLHHLRSATVRYSLRDASNEENLDEDAATIPHSSSSPASSQSRRQALVQMMAVPSALALASASIVEPALAARPEIDSKSGVLFSPKGQMLGGGGSDATRGIKIRDRTKDTAQQQRRSFAKSVGLIQTVYNVRFVTYLSRFILNFDPAARSWWLEEANQLSNKNVGPDAATMAEQLRFAEFAESVEVGLADYFTGPYGSYASLEAAKAGVNARAPATSGGIINTDNGKKFDFAKLLGFVGKARKMSSVERKKLRMNEVKQKRQGIKNLLTLLKARYTTIGAKEQLALLFALIDDPELQPAAEITGLLGEADNASVTSLELIGSQNDDSDYRLSSRRGGGYAIDSPLKVEIEPPPALGQDYRPAKIEPIMRPTSRVLKIRVLDGGAGYKTPPAVTVTQKGTKRPCDAVAILDRYGSVDSILVLDPGYGYGNVNDRRGPTEPAVEIAPPQRQGGKQVIGKILDKKTNDDTDTNLFRQATAKAELEYAIKEIKIEDPGSGYTISQPPKISIRPCERDPEWYVAPAMTYGQGSAGVIVARDEILKRPEFLQAKVTKMTLGFYNTTVYTNSDALVEAQFDSVDPTVIGRVAGDSLYLLPNSIRPELSPVFDRYIVPDLPPIPEDLSGIALPSQKYRAIDPIFGGIGSKPVTIGAKDLTVGEYSRLALAGATCTVLVRTLLNPLELVKTKLQLGNDVELLEYALKEKKKSSQSTKAASDVGKTTVKAEVARSNDLSDEEEDKIGTLDLITSLVKCRGPFSLFQSADITFLASLVFGSFGFGATELFRRFFTNAIFEEGPGGGTGEELVLLGAAALACVMTSFAATPFEMIRVQSMGKVEAQGWTEVLANFLADKRSTRSISTVRGGTGAIPAPNSEVSGDEFKLKDIKKEDLKPLFSGFAPIVSRELPFAITKFLVFDLLAKTIMALLNSQGNFVEPVQVGVGPTGLAVSAVAGAVAGIAGAIISHPADLILTLQSSSTKSESSGNDGEEGGTNSTDWRPLVKELLEKDGGVANLFVGLPARALFFFLVIGLQFFLYDFVKGLFNVSSDDLTLVLDVFYAIRRGLVEGP